MPINGIGGNPTQFSSMAMIRRSFNEAFNAVFDVLKRHHEEMAKMDKQFDEKREDTLRLLKQKLNAIKLKAQANPAQAAAELRKLIQSPEAKQVVNEIPNLGPKMNDLLKELEKNGAAESDDPGSALEESITPKKGASGLISLLI